MLSQYYIPEAQAVEALEERLLSLQKTARATGKSFKRALADFDQLDRLSFGSGSGSSSGLKTTQKQVAETAKSIQESLWPLQNLDFSLAEAAFARLRQAAEPLSRALFAGLEWAWTNILQPISLWGREQALPLFLDTLRAGLGVLAAAVNTAKPLLSWLWEGLLKPMGQWAGQTLLTALQSLSAHLSNLAQWLTAQQPAVAGLVQRLEGLRQGFVNLCGGLGLFRDQSGMVGTGLSLLCALAQTLGQRFQSVATAAAWLGAQVRAMLNSLTPAFRLVANTAIGLVNTALSGMEAAINAMVTALNSLRIDIPKWVPLVGGRKFAMNLSYVNLPSVPYLAQGAVLPANQPFLAVVGDQRRGTNVEAPLSTIQEAVANVLTENQSVQLDTNKLLGQILTAIDAIEVGDTTIGRAARRYESRMAVMGGAL